MSITNTNNLVERYPYIIVSSGPEESEQVIHLIEPDKMIQEKLMSGPTNLQHEPRGLCEKIITSIKQNGKKRE